MRRILKYIIIILLVPTTFVSAQEEFILKINGRPVYKSEFIFYYNRSKCASPKAFLPSFISYEQQLEEAKEIGIDTLSSFKYQLQYYKTFLNKEQSYKCPLISHQKETWVKLYNIDKHLPQNSNQQTIKKTESLMDSLYNLLLKGADFNEIASKYSDDYNFENKKANFEYIKLSLLPNEIINKITSSSKAELIPPFISPSGLHIIKVVDVKDSVIINKSSIQKEIDDKDYYNDKYLENDLIVSIYRKLHDNSIEKVTEKDLENYFKHNASRYQNDVPMYKGALIRCSSKKVGKIIKKYLKKYPQEEWKAKIDELTKNDNFSLVKYIDGIFKSGDNIYVDKLVFKKKIKFVINDALPYSFVMGKKLPKIPYSYKDVYDKVYIDYLNYKEIDKKKALDEKYKVEINDAVLKTVNNSGSN